MLKIVSTLTLLLMLFGLSACSCTPEYIIKPVEVEIPIQCIVPEYKCATKEELQTLNDSEVIYKTIECIAGLRQASTVCQGE